MENGATFLYFPKTCRRLEMNELWQQVIAACATVGAAIISAYVIINRSKTDRRTAEINAANEQVDSIFSVYGQIVADLRTEVNRLQTEIEVLREEQQVCEERNANLETLVTELVARVKCLEGE
jgi:peptidoglycan hydrolase CwlO-like protein